MRIIAFRVFDIDRIQQNNWCVYGFGGLNPSSIKDHANRRLAARCLQSICYERVFGVINKTAPPRLSGWSVIFQLSFFWRLLLVFKKLKCLRYLSRYRKFLRWPTPLSNSTSTVQNASQKISTGWLWLSCLVPTQSFYHDVLQGRFLEAGEISVLHYGFSYCKEGAPTPLLAVKLRNARLNSQNSRHSAAHPLGYILTVNFKQEKSRNFWVQFDWKKVPLSGQMSRAILIFLSRCRDDSGFMDSRKRSPVPKNCIRSTSHETSNFLQQPNQQISILSDFIPRKLKIAERFQAKFKGVFSHQSFLWKFGHWLCCMFFLLRQKLSPFESAERPLSHDLPLSLRSQAFSRKWNRLGILYCSIVVTWWHSSTEEIKQDLMVFLHLEWIVILAYIPRLIELISGRFRLRGYS